MGSLPGPRVGGQGRRKGFDEGPLFPGASDKSAVQFRQAAGAPWSRIQSGLTHLSGCQGGSERGHVVVERHGIGRKEDQLLCEQNAPAQGPARAGTQALECDQNRPGMLLEDMKGGGPLRGDVRVQL